MVAQPHFLLFCDTHHSDNQLGASGPASGYVGSGGRWHFVLEQLDGPERLEAADSELAMNRERLALLSVVRGLEALEQPSQVTLVTTSRYVSRGLRYGLNTWRDSDYTWERFGEQRPVRNSDLWRRVDTALQFHGIKCRLIQAGQANSPQLSPEPALAAEWQAAVDSQATPASGALAAPWAVDSFSTESMVATSIRRAPVLRVGKSEFPRTTAVLARDLRGASNRWHAASASRKVENLRVNWWNLAAAWIRWWRGRFQHRPAFYGT